MRYSDDPLRRRIEQLNEDIVQERLMGRDEDAAELRRERAEARRQLREAAR